MRRFELTDVTSHKFWQIERDGKALRVHFGRIGTDGQAQMKKFSSEDRAATELEKLVGEKLRKGYVERGARARRGTAKAPAPRAKGGTPPLAAVLGELAAVTDASKRKPASAANFASIAKLLGCVPPELSALYELSGNLDVLCGEPADSQQWLSPGTAILCTRDIRKCGAPENVLAVSTDHGGNYSCFETGTGRILDWDHETRKTRVLAPSLAIWLKTLVRAVAREVADKKAIASEKGKAVRASGFPENPKRLVPVPSALLSKLARPSYGGGIQGLAFLCEDRIVASFSQSGSVFKLGNKKDTFVSSAGGSLAYDAKSNRIVFAPWNKIVLFDAKGPALIASFETALGWGQRLQLSPNGALACASSQEIQLWDARRGKGKRIASLRTHTDASVDFLRFSPDGALLASCDSDGTLCLWDTRKRELVRRVVVPETSRASGVDFAPDGASLFAGLSSGKVVV